MVTENLTEKTFLEKFETFVQNEQKKENLSFPPGNDSPHFIEVTNQIIQRDSKVKVWVLKNANGICELCSKEAPFIGTDGSPYLEVHHIRHLSNGGTDTIYNTVALCPNCHRELHYGQNKNKKITQLYKTIKRLTKE